MIQVLSGTFRHRRLTSPKGSQTRPTTSQVRAAVFNICQNSIEGANFLDICAGSGSMGIEAISRGAEQATFIDHDRFAILAIRENIKLLGIEEKTEVYSGDALLLLKRLKRDYSLCYFDPPYSRQNQKNHFVKEVLEALDKNEHLIKDAYLFLEESAHFELETIELQSLKLDSKRRFGDSFLYCFRKV